MSKVEFSGNLEGTPEQKVSLLLDIAKRSPLYFKTGMELIRAGGLRDFHGFSIEKIGQNEQNQPIISIKERGQLRKSESTKRLDIGFRQMSIHCAAVLLTGDSLGEIINISSHEQDILTTSLLAHDASKRLEVLMQGFWSLIQTNSITEETEKIVNEALARQGFNRQNIETEKIVAQTKRMNALEFSDYFDTINRDFIERNLRLTTLPYEDQERIKIVSTSDTFGSLPRIIACTKTFSSDLPEDPTIRWFRSFSNKLIAENKLPEVKGNVDDFLSLIVWYADAIVHGTTMKLVDDRLNQAGKNYPDIEEGARRMFEMTYYQADIPTVHVIERIFTKRAQEADLLPTNFTPEELPIAILDNLQRRI